MARNVIFVLVILFTSLFSFGYAQYFAYVSCPKIKSGYHISMEQITGQKYYALAQMNLQGVKPYGDSDLCAEVTINKELKIDWNIRYRSNKEWNIEGDLKLIAEERDGLFNITFPSRKEPRVPYEYAGRISQFQNYEYVLIYGCQNIEGDILFKGVVVSWFLSKKPTWTAKALEVFHSAIKEWELKDDNYSMVDQDYEQCRLRTTVSPPSSATAEEVTTEEKTSTTLSPETTDEVKITNPTLKTSNADRTPTPETPTPPTTAQNYHDNTYFIPGMQNTFQNFLSLQWSLLLAIVVLVTTTVVIGMIVFFVALPFIRERQNKAVSRLPNISSTISVDLPKYEKTEYEKTVP